MNELVETACGAQNSLAKLSHQIRSSVARQQDGSGSSLLQDPGPSNLAPTTFHMGTLLQELQHVEEGHSPNLKGPSAEHWAKDFLIGRMLPLARMNHASCSFASPAQRSPMTTSVAPPGSSQRVYVPLTPQMRMAFQPTNFHNAPISNTKWATDILTQSELSSAAEESKRFNDATDRAQAGNNTAISRTSGDNSNTNNSPCEDYKRQLFLRYGPTHNARGERRGTVYYERIDLADPLYSYVNYPFNEQTPVDRKGLQEPFEEGLRKLRQGDLPSAVLLFEAAVKKDSNHAAAWQYLGTTQLDLALNVHAIAALRQCVSLDAQNIVALRALAYAFLNEKFCMFTRETLWEWLRVNPKYKHLIPSAEPRLTPSRGEITHEMEQQAFRKITDLYIRAAQMQPNEPDADLQFCLSLLLRTNSQIDEATDCCKVCVSVRPDDANMWLRLGTLLMSLGRDAESIEAFRHALQLNPSLVKAREGIGICCNEMGCIEEALQHTISALRIQNLATAGKRFRNRGPSPWSTLACVLIDYGRDDLAESVYAGDLSGVNQMILEARKRGTSLE